MISLATKKNFFYQQTIGKGFHFHLHQTTVYARIVILSSISIKIVNPQRDDADVKLKFSTLVFSSDLIYVATTMTLSNARCRNGGSRRKGKRKEKRKEEEEARERERKRVGGKVVLALTHCCRGPQINCPSSSYLSPAPPSPSPSLSSSK